MSATVPLYPLTPESFNFADLLASHPGLEVGALVRSAPGAWGAAVQPATAQVFTLWATGETPRDAVRAALARYVDACTRREPEPTRSVRRKRFTLEDLDL